MIYYVIFSYLFIFGMSFELNRDQKCKDISLSTIVIVFLLSPFVLPIILGVVFYEKTNTE